MSLEEKQVLIIYSTTDGQALKISKFIANRLKASVDIVSIEDEIPELKSYDGVIIGASIRYGKHRASVAKYINKNYKELQNKVNAFFSISLISRNPERRLLETNQYAAKFLKKVKWKPQNILLVGGMLNYPKYSLFDRFMIQIIMKMTKGPTDPSTVIEYTDWDQIENFVNEFNAQLS